MLPPRFRFWLTVLLVLGTLYALLARADIATHEIPDTVPEPPPIPADLVALEETVEGWYDATPEERAAYATWLVLGLEYERAVSQRALESRSKRRQEETRDLLIVIFNILRNASFALLLLPLVFWRRYAGRRLAFTGYCVLGVILLSLMFQLMGGLLRVAVDVSTVAGSKVNPQHAMLDAAFDLAEERIGGWTAPASEGGLPVGPTMGSLESSESGDFFVQLLENLKYFDVSVLEIVIQAASIVHHLFGLIPHLIPVLVSLLFVITTRVLFLRIATMPMRAMRGETRVGRGALKLALLTFWRELLAVAVFVGVLLLPAVSMQLAVRYVGYAVTESSVEQAVSFVDYMGRLTAAPDRVQSTIGLLGIPVGMLICLGVYMLSFVGYSIWARRLTQVRFHRGVPLRSHGRFWRSAWARLFRIQWSLALLLFFGLPILLGLLELHPHQTSESALASMFWRGLLAVVLLLAGAVLMGVPGDVWWFVRFRPGSAPDETSGSPAASSPEDGGEGHAGSDAGSAAP